MLKQKRRRHSVQRMPSSNIRNARRDTAGDAATDLQYGDC